MGHPLASNIMSLLCHLTLSKKQYLYPHLFSGCLAIPESAAGMSVPVCFGVQTVHNYEIVR